jgi:prophage antirepressor-like protein
VDGIEGGVGVNIVPFEFDGAAVRTITADDAEVLFVGKDVAAALGYIDTPAALKQHCRGAAVHRPIVDALGRTQQVRVITEPDVMRLIVSSKLPAAERFERWVFEEVLPQIRRTGSYGVAAPKDMIEALTLALEQAKQIEAQKAIIAEQSADVEALKRIANTDGLLTPRDAAKAVGVSPTALNRWLDAHGWTYVQGGRRHAYQKRIESGDLAQKVYEVGPPEDLKSVVQVYVTMAGAAKLAKRVKS